MATSLIAKPEPIAPAYNPLKFIYSSTNVNNDGFRYIFDIYDNTATKIAEYRVLPNLDGYGEIDLSRLLQSYVSFDFDPTATDQDPTNSYFEYDVNVGEEYIQDVSYTASLTQNGTYTKITATHAFQVGDQVVITQVSPGTDNPTMDGLHTVTAITGTTDFTVNVLWSDITDATIDGSVAYADGRKTVTRDIITSTGNYVFNGAIPFKDYRTYVDDDYIADDAGASLVSSQPTTFRITPEQDVWLNVMINGNSLGRMVFTNDSGDVAYRLVTDTDLLSQQLLAGDLSGLTVSSGTLPIVKDTTEYYTVWFYEGSIKSSTYRFEIDRRCKINDYEIAFLDRMGSISSFAFQLRDKLTGTVNKEVYNQHIEGSVVSNQWTYGTTAQGKRVIYPTIEEVFTLNTNWMEESAATYFTELVSSPQTWIKIDGTYYSCIVKDNGYEKERSKNRTLIRKTIQVSLSVQDRVNG